MLNTLSLTFVLAAGFAAAQDKPKAPAIKVSLADEARKTVRTAIDGMTCAGGVGGMLIENLQKDLLVDIEVRDGATKLVELREIPADIPVRTIVFSPLIGATSPRYATLHIAEQAAMLKYDWMPSTAERDFMVMSLTARAWFEMGGSRKGLPSFDGKIDDARLAGKIDRWVDGGGMDSYVREENAKGRSTLADHAKFYETRLASKKAALAEAKARLKRATCASDERACLKEIDELERLVRGIEQELATVKDWQKKAAEFKKAETEWFWVNQGSISVQ